MQTFLPFPNFAVSAMHLDYRRLGKQRVEARQILSALQEGGGWSNHPATTMWRGHIDALALYGDVMIREWVRRGYNNSMYEMITNDASMMADILTSEKGIKMPHWLGDEAFHAAHRSRLLMKDPDWYGQFGWSEEPGREYIWPGEKE